MNSNEKPQAVPEYIAKKMIASGITLVQLCRAFEARRTPGQVDTSHIANVMDQYHVTIDEVARALDALR